MGVGASPTFSTKAGDKLIVAADNTWQGERLGAGEKFTAAVEANF